MSDAITIRAAQPRDVPAIEACAHEAYTRYVARIGREPAPMVANFAGQVARGTVQVAIDAGGGLAGFVVCYPRGDHMHLENVAVRDDHRGKGIGRRLIERCEQQARAAGLAAVELYTNAKMAENLTLYPHLGYREVGRRTEDGFARVFYRKKLPRD